MRLLFKKHIVGSNPSTVRKLIDEMMSCIEEWNSLEECEYYEFRLILSELISNGIFHGNKGLAHKKIHVAIEEVNTYTLGILISDEGKGFNYKYICDKLSNMEGLKMSEGGRGLMLVNALCGKIEFNKNGNEIKITKSICPE